MVPFLKNIGVTPSKSMARPGGLRTQVLYCCVLGESQVRTLLTPYMWPEMERHCHSVAHLDDDWWRRFAEAGNCCQPDGLWCGSTRLSHHPPITVRPRIANTSMPKSSRIPSLLWLSLCTLEQPSLAYRYCNTCGAR